MVHLAFHQVNITLIHILEGLHNINIFAPSLELKSLVLLSINMCYIYKYIYIYIYVFYLFYHIIIFSKIL